MSLLITTGATETFKSLIQFSANEKFLSFVTNHTKITKIIIQFGNNTQFFQQCLARIPNLKQSTTQNHFGIETESYIYDDKLRIQAYQFNPNILKDIEDLDYIISHAGTGSILDSLRLKKPLLVIVNDKLMDNHQLDIAQEFQNDNFLTYYQFRLGENSELFTLINSFLNGEMHFKLLPPANKNLLNELINED